MAFISYKEITENIRKVEIVKFPSPASNAINQKFIIKILQSGDFKTPQGATLNSKKHSKSNFEMYLDSTDKENITLVNVWATVKPRAQKPMQSLEHLNNNNNKKEK